MKTFVVFILLFSSMSSYSEECPQDSRVTYSLKKSICSHGRKKWFISNKSFMKTAPKRSPASQVDVPYHLDKIERTPRETRKWYISNRPFLKNKTKREVASVNENVSSIKPKANIGTNSRFSISTSFGNLSIKQSNQNLSMNLSKITGSYNFKIDDNYTLNLNASLNYFFNFRASELNDEISGGSIYPDFGVAVYRKLNDRWSLGASYDVLNYFIISSSTDLINLSPTRIHRTSLRPSFYISDRFSLLGGVGYLNTLNSDQISGIDFTLGGSYLLGDKKNYRLVGILYRNNLSLNNGDSEEATAALASFGILF